MTPKFAFFLKILCVCLLVTFAALPTWSQGGNQASIEGTVLDPSGAVVADATITATNVETGATSTSTTSGDGFFRFPLLPVGTYDVTVERSGFARVTQKGIVLTVGGRLNLPISLKVATAAEAVEVSAEVPLVETTRSAVSTTVDSRSIANLPVNGRNFIEFALLTPGVTRDGQRLGDISFGGLRGTLNSLVIDGTDNNNTFFGQAAGRTGTGRAPYQFSQDAVQEFQVNTNGYSAELGRAGGAVINAITKSGNNAFHGSAFWYYRDQSLNAGNPFNKIFNDFTANPALHRSVNPPYHYNQYGGSLGGFFIKDKLFFFANYDGQRNTQPNSVTFNPPVLSSDPVVAQFQAAAINYLAARSQSWVRTQDQDDYLGKLDWIVNSKHNASVRWNKQHFAGGNFENSGATRSEESTGAANVRTTSITASVNSTITPTLVNVARFSYVHDREPGQANSILPELFISDGSFTFTAGRNFFSPRETTIDRYQYGNSVTYVRGRHTLKTGVDVIHDRIFNFFPGVSNGSYRFTLEQFGRNLCRGGSVTFTVPCGPVGGSYNQNFFGDGTQGPITEPNLFDLGLYLQDDWKITSRFTLNLGIRYDIDTYDQPTVRNPTALLAGFDTSRINKDYNNVAPRIGFAWTPVSERWVWRGGYGIFYSRTPAIALSTAFSQNGLAVQNRAVPTTSPLFPNYPNSVCGPVDAAGSSCAPPAALASAAPPIIIVAENDFRQPYVQQWNLSTEYELTRDLAVSVGYLGVKGTKLTRFRDVNLFAPVAVSNRVFLNGQPITVLRYPGATATATAPIRPNPAFSRIEQIEAAGSSIYHGLVVGATKRFSRNFQALASYTWSHGIDDNPDATAVVPGGSDDTKLNYSPLLPGIDRASGETDIRHRFVLSGVWDLNYFSGLPAVPKAILEGWQISGILNAQGGQPYTAHVSGTGNDLNNDGIFNTERPPFLGRNTFRLPKNVSFDPRIVRKIKVREGMQFELFAEAFNIFNRFNYYSANFNQFSVATATANPITSPCGAGVPSGAVCLRPTVNNATGFGMPREIIGAQPVQRVVQLGTKFTF